MSFVDRFKAKKLQSPTVKVPFGGLEFLVQRFSLEESIGTTVRAREALQRAGYINPDDNVFSSYVAMELFNTVKRHVKSWEPGETGIEYSKANAEALFAEMTPRERGEFLQAHAEAEKKTSQG